MEIIVNEESEGGGVKIKEMNYKILLVINMDLESLLCTIFHNGKIPHHLSFSLIDRLHTETGMLQQW